jgi:DNA-binding IclR family transcriptional regulator
MRVNDNSVSRSELERVAATVDDVAQDAGQLGLDELACRVGVKESTVQRLIAEMVIGRLLDRGTYGYCLGFHISESRLPATSSYVLAQAGSSMTL